MWHPYRYRYLEKAGPVLELVHDVPGVGHGHAQQHRRVLVVALRQGKVQQVRVRRVPIQDPMAQTRVIYKLSIKITLKSLGDPHNWTKKRQKCTYRRSTKYPYKSLKKNKHHYNL